MFKSLFQSKVKIHFLHKSNIKVRFIIAAIFCLITSVSHAVDSTATKSQASQRQSNSIGSKPNALPEWVYRELSSIQKEVSVLDATGASKKSVQVLKERLIVVEEQLKQSQLRVDGSLKAHGDRIEDLHASSEQSLDTISWATTWFGIVIGTFGIIITVIAYLLNLNFKREAIESAEDEAKKIVNIWTTNKEIEINGKFEKQAEEHEIRFEEIRDEADLQAVNNEINEAYALVRNENIDDALMKINSIIEKYKNSSKLKSQKIHVKALLYLGIIYNAATQKDKALQIYEELIILFQGIDDIYIQQIVGATLWNKAVLLSDLDRSDKAIDGYHDIIKRFDGEKSEFFQDFIAKSYVNIGTILGKLNRSEEAIETFDYMVEYFRKSKSLIVLDKIASALLNKGHVLRNLELFIEEIEVYDEIYSRFGKSKELVLQTKIVKALFAKGVALSKLEKFQESIDTYFDMAKQFGDIKELSIQEKIAIALVNNGIRLGQLERLEESIDVYSDVVRRFGDNKEIVLQEQIAKALIGKSLTLKELEQPKKEIKVYEDIIHRFGDSKDLTIQIFIAKALSNTAVVLNESGDLVEVIKVYDDLIQKFEGIKDLAIQAEVASALVNKATALGKLDHLEEAFVTFDNMVNEFSKIDDPTIVKLVASCLSNKAEFILVKRNENEAKKAIATAIDFFEDKFSVNRVVMELFNFIIKEVELDSVMTLVDKIPDDEKLGWEFEILYPMIDSLDYPHKEQVKAIARFFEEHKDKEKLKTELAEISSK